MQRLTFPGVVGGRKGSGAGRAKSPSLAGRQVWQQRRRLVRAQWVVAGGLRAGRVEQIRTAAQHHIIMHYCPARPAWLLAILVAFFCFVAGAASLLAARLLLFLDGSSPSARPARRLRRRRVSR